MIAQNKTEYKVEESLFGSIMENDKKISKYRSAPPNVHAADTATSTLNVSRTSASTKASELGPAESKKDGSSFKHIIQPSAVAFAKFKVCIDSVDKVAEASILKSGFIVYRIRFTRMSDLQSHACWKRFKEIHAWYTEVRTVQLICVQLFTFFFSS